MVFCVFIMGFYIGIKDWVGNGYSTFYLVFGIQKIRKNHTFYRWCPLRIAANNNSKGEQNGREFV